MTEAICYRDAYAREVDAAVVSVEASSAAPGHEGAGWRVVLDRTVFYPGGGGQPPDSGWLVATDGRRWAVSGARRDGAAIVHEIEAATGDRAPVTGEGVSAVLDWHRRYLLMRTHTALHVLCGVVFRDHGALVTGGHMEPGQGRMDFEFESLTGELVGSIEAAVNAELARDRPVQVRILPRAEALAIPDLIRTKVNLLPEGITEIRVIDIVGLDLQADGGTHVADTREVGRVVVTGYESKGRINKRIRIRLDDPA